MNERELAQIYDGIKGREPKVLYIDIETSYAVGKFWGNRTYKVDILGTIQDSMPIMVGWMWHTDKKPSSVCLKDFKGYKPGLFNINDRGVVEKAWELLDEADIVIGQNSNKFDVPMLMARFWHYGMPAPSGFVQEDTKVRAKKAFYLASYKLSHMLKYRGLPQKTDAGGIGTWDSVIDEGIGWERMGKYCRNDVAVLRPLWESMSGFGKPKVVANLITRKTNHCPNATCMSTDIMKDGKRPLKTGWKQRLVCRKCATKWTTDLVREEEKIDITLS